MSGLLPNLRVIGFCGVDDTVSPELLKLISDRYKWVEWGVLFRSDLEGQARYPTKAWVQKLSVLSTDPADPSSLSVQLAGHLCADRCQAVLEGDSSFVHELYELGFRRVQVNATAANSVTVDPEQISKYVSNIKKCMQDESRMEFIIQCNEETKPIYEQLIADPEPNMSILYDASCGKGVRVNNFPSPMLNPSIPCGYAGGIGPDCIADIISAVNGVTNACPVPKTVWVDMESSLRTIVVTKSKSKAESSEPEEVRTDVFSIDKCFACILIAEKFGMK